MSNATRLLVAKHDHKWQKRAHRKIDVRQLCYHLPVSQLFFSVWWAAWLCFYQTRSAWSVDQGSNRKHSAVHNFAPTVTKCCVMWEGQALPHDTKFSNCRCEIVGRRVIFIWSLIHGSSWSGLIKAEPEQRILVHKSEQPTARLYSNISPIVWLSKTMEYYNNLWCTMSMPFSNQWPMW